MAYDDAPLDDLLKRRKWSGATAGGEAGPTRPASRKVCGDAEMLAAYAEGRLAGDQRTRFEQHIAACLSCQTAIVRLVRLAPAESAAAAAAGSAKAARAPWFSLRLRFAVPVLASALLVGSFVYLERENIVQPPQSDLHRAVRTDAIAPPPAATREEARTEPKLDADVKKRAVAPAGRVKNEKDESRDRFSPEPPASKPAQLEAQSKRQAPGGGFAQQAPAPRVLEDRRDAAFGSARAGAVVGGVPAPPAPAAAPRMAERDQMAERTAVTLSKAAAPGKLLASGSKQFLLDSEGQLKSNLAPSTDWLMVRLPGGARALDYTVQGTHVWALLPGGRIVHSADLGSTWDTPVESGAEDATSILFSSPRSGEIRTSSGRRLVTEDAGRTWK